MDEVSELLLPELWAIVAAYMTPNDIDVVRELDLFADGHICPDVVEWFDENRCIWFTLVNGLPHSVDGFPAMVVRISAFVTIFRWRIHGEIPAIDMPDMAIVTTGLQPESVQLRYFGKTKFAKTSHICDDGECATCTHWKRRADKLSRSTKYANIPPPDLSFGNSFQVVRRANRISVLDFVQL